MITAALMDGYNQMVVALRGYQAQAMQDQGLGGGGKLAVDGGAAPTQTSAAEPVQMVASAEPTRDVPTASAAAIRSYQKNHNMTVTGQLDGATLNALSR